MQTQRAPADSLAAPPVERRRARNRAAAPRFRLPDSSRRLLARWLFSPLQGARLEDWAPVLRRYAHAIPPPYWPRAAFTTLTSAIHSVLEPLEQHRFGEQITRTPVRRPLFVLGHHRSGTTHLWNLLSIDPRSAYPSVAEAVLPHDFLLLHTAVSGLARHVMMSSRPQDGVALSPDAPSGDEKALCASTFCSIQMARHFPQAREQYAHLLTMRQASRAERARWKNAIVWFMKKLTLHHGEDKTLVLRAPDHTAKVALLREAFPDARFVHIHRDPYRVFASTRKLEEEAHPFVAYQPMPAGGLDDFIIWRYRETYRAFFEDIDRLPSGDWVDVSYSELTRAPVATLEHVYAQLGLGDFAAVRSDVQAYMEAVARYRRNRYPPLPEELRARIAEEWTFAFRRWGYSR